MAFRIPEVTSCCGSISLRTGAKIFGFLSLLGCFFLSVMSTWEMYMVIKYTDEEYEETTLLLSADILFQTVQMTTSVLLVLAAYQENAQLVPPWLVSTPLVAVLELVFLPAIPHRIIGLESSDYHFYLLTIMMLVDDVYGWLVVYSFYRSIRSRQQLV